MKGSVFGLFLSIFKSVSGTGVLAMPYCFMRAGWAVGLLLVTIVWLCTVRAVLQVCACALKVSDEEIEKRAHLSEVSNTTYDTTSTLNNTTHIGYVELARRSFQNSVSGPLVAFLCIVPCQWIACVTYIIFIAENSTPIIAPQWDHRVMVIIITLIEMFLCVPKSTKHLSLTSALGNIAFFSGIGAVLYHALRIHGVLFDRIAPYTTFTGAFEAFGILVFAFAAHVETLELIQDTPLNVRKRYAFAAVSAFLLAFVSFVGFSFLVYAAFGESTNAVLFLNLPDDNPVLSVLRMCVSLMLVCGYPLVMYPVFHVFEPAKPVDSIPGRKRGISALYSRICTYRHVTTLVRWIIVISSGVCATFATHGFGPVSSIGGGLTASTAFILPSLFHTCIFSNKLSKSTKILNYIVISMGIVCGVLSIVSGFVSVT